MDCIQVKVNKTENIVSGHQFEAEGDNRISFKIGESVWYQNCFKNYMQWLPSILIKRESKMCYRIKVNGVEKLAHINQLKKNYDRSIPQFISFETAGRTLDFTVVRKLIQYRRIEK